MKKIVKIILVTAIFLILIINLSFRNSRDRELKVEQYLPNTIMTKYFTGGLTHIIEFTEKKKTHIVEKGTRDDGIEYEVLREYKGSDDKISLLSTRLRKPYLSFPYSKDYVILQGPLEVGTKWTYESFEETRNHEITGVNTKVFTRMGIFYTVEVTTTSWNYELKEYYAKNIGLVKRTTIRTDGEESDKRTFTITSIKR